MLSEDDHIRFRKQILMQINPFLQPLPPNPSVAFAWPTELCSVGCAHCNYSSVIKGTEEQRLLSRYAKDVVGWVSAAGAKRFVVCGGGEPLDEPEFLVEAIEECAKAGIDFEVYTSGVSNLKPLPIENHIQSWIASWKHKVRANQRFNVRLSLDAFHEEIIGLGPLVEWIGLLQKLSPEWSISIRGVRLEGDLSVNRLTELLNGTLTKKNCNSGFIQLPSGQKIVVQWKGFVLEGRGQLKQLERLNLKLPPEDYEIIAPYMGRWNRKDELGRPFSLRHAVSFHRIDIEIHANCEVHILQSQAIDVKLNFLNSSWEEIRDAYYRDPLLHCVVEKGLSAIASLLSECQNVGITQNENVPFSIERISNPVILAWITAKTVLINGKQFIYDDKTISLSQEYLSQFK